MKKYKKTSMGNDNVDFLKKFGLSTYESMAYITLTSLITATATEISENSCIPRPKIYQTLKSLHEKNFIEIERGRPLKFTVINPQEIFTREKQVF
ncbi:transcriptional regulator, partial [Methanobrevibacter sp. OttesenSCG-928-I08]|nr:transcriptional regulator [Methanobrevibacter sp. OttesenSCG-928-I08]